MPNESEAETITGIPVKALEDARNAAEFMLAQAWSAWSLPWGERGSMLADSHACEFIPAFTVGPRCTTGAGDAFIGVVCGVSGGGTEREVPPPRGGEELYAAMSTMRVGTQKSFPTREEFDNTWRGGLPAGNSFTTNRRRQSLRRMSLVFDATTRRTEGAKSQKLVKSANSSGRRPGTAEAEWARISFTSSSVAPDVRKPVEVFTQSAPTSAQSRRRILCAS